MTGFASINVLFLIRQAVKGRVVNCSNDDNDSPE